MYAYLIMLINTGATPPRSKANTLNRHLSSKLLHTELDKSGSTAVRLLGLRVRIPPGAWMSVSYECCVVSGRGLCDRPITRPEESYRVWCVSERDFETSVMRRPRPAKAVET
jgi:hypothetical protein